MNITLSADEALVKRARQCARKQGKSLNGYLREKMEDLTHEGGSAEADEFLRLVRERPGSSEDGYVFNREEAHERR